MNPASVSLLVLPALLLAGCYRTAGDCALSDASCEHWRGFLFYELRDRRSPFFLLLSQTGTTAYSSDAAGQNTGGNTAVFYSGDGQSWTEVALADTVILERIAASDERAIACGGDGTIVWASSTDAVNWTINTPAGISHLKYSLQEDGVFYFTSLNLAGSYATTNDGANWAIHTLPGFPTAQLVGIAKDGDKFVFGNAGKLNTIHLALDLFT